MHGKGENLKENHIPPVVSEICTKQQINEENSSCPRIAFCRKERTTVETLSLRNLKIKPRNLNESVLS